MDVLDVEDVLGDSIGLFGDEGHDDGRIYYGPLVLTTAPKVRIFGCLKRYIIYGDQLQEGKVTPSRQCGLLQLVTTDVNPV